MNFVRLTLDWVFGIVFLLAGLYLSREFLLPGVFLILISLVLVPPVRRIVYSITKREMSPISRAYAVLFLLFAFGISAVVTQIRNDRSLRAMGPEEQIQQEHALSLKRHRDFFLVDKWKHSEYVETNGAGLCVICHSLEPGGQTFFGPKCSTCHRDLPAFRQSIQPRSPQPLVRE